MFVWECMLQSCMSECCICYMYNVYLLMLFHSWFHPHVYVVHYIHGKRQSERETESPQKFVLSEIIEISLFAIKNCSLLTRDISSYNVVPGDINSYTAVYVTRTVTVRITLHCALSDFFPWIPGMQIASVKFLIGSSDSVVGYNLYLFSEWRNFKTKVCTSPCRTLL